MDPTPFIPSPEQREEVRALAATGAADEDIAAYLGISEKKLRKFYRDEVRKGSAAGKQQAINKLHRIVSSEDDNLSALIFWIKAQCGWRDTGTPTSGATVARPLLIVKKYESVTPA